MKKISIKSLAVIIILASIIYSCNTEEQVNLDASSEQPIFKRLGDNPVLFTYDTKEECSDNMINKIPTLALDAKEDILGDIDRIFTKVIVSNGKAIVEEVHYLSVGKSQYIRSLVFNPGTGAYDLVNVNVPFGGGPVVGTPILDLLQGGCPEGWWELGECEHGETYANCMGGMVEMLDSQGLTAGSSNRAVMMQTGIGGSLLCGKFW